MFQNIKGQATTLDSSVGKNPPFLCFSVAIEIVSSDCVDNPNIEQGCGENFPSGVLPHNTYTGVWRQQGCDFRAPDLEWGIYFRDVSQRGIIFRTYESSLNYQPPFEIIHREFISKKICS